jgi:hypothetical protein
LRHEQTASSEGEASLLCGGHVFDLHYCRLQDHFVGKRFTYVFSAPPALIDAFKSPFYPHLRAHLAFATSDSNVWGDVDLELADEASEDQKQAAEMAGYKRSLPM